MWHIGIDLHRETIVMAAVNDTGEAMKPVTIRLRGHRSDRGRREGLGPFRAVIEASGNVSLALRLAPSARHDPLGPSAAPPRHDTTPLENRQAGRPIAGESAADQPDSAGLHSAGALSAVARPGALPARGWAANWPRPKSNCGTCWRRQNREAPYRSTLRRSRLGVVSGPRLRADRKSGPRRTAGAAGAFRPANRPSSTGTSGEMAAGFPQTEALPTSTASACTRRC